MTIKWIYDISGSKQFVRRF